ncbi:DNA topoisomerase i [Heliomicrobium modesticaldum Ice1]|uniref:DNA topoisomerase 1 n=1 Tax=Heliobacterium modesticaldum (strain ATCC 51547 / Ice1) TaxID=498761 RepID=B0TH92_HELMI|nr:type I DNA topoisomerase [Heliomicrobium modesticaldum]ABZ84767.1 DNA topoisomerase i [Heliomicrobium modesticaldum Ice1]
MSNKVLVIVESPAKAKTIGKFLGRRYQVKASMGHVRDLPKSQFGVDVDGGFNPKYITIRGKGELLKELRTAAKKSDQILLGPDPDREGEAIAWHLAQVLGVDEHTPCRIEFNEITKSAIQKAVKKPRPIDTNRVEAQQARRILDRLVGYNLSPLLWRKIRKGLSAGRVQSVAVRLISDREEEINDFTPDEYWSLTAELKAVKGNLQARLVRQDENKLEIKSREEMDRILGELAGQVFAVSEVKRKEKRRNPSPPFTTSSLQQEAYRKLGFTARKTMMIAQQLYEGLDLGKEGTVGLVTYIRTDSVRVSDGAVEEVRQHIQTRFGSDYLPAEPRVYENKGKIQNAHEAIRPTSVTREPETLKAVVTNDQYKLYKLIYERFISSQMSSAIMDTTTIEIKAGAFGFRASGAVLKFPGFMKVYIEGRDDDSKEEEGLLPEVSVDEKLDLQKLEPKQHFTQPPPRYSEATLVRALEERGIGRPSTYAPIIETIVARGYVVREDKQFYLTELGEVVVDLLKEHFPDIIDVEFTADMEAKLDAIEEGAADWRRILRDFYEPFRETLEEAEEKIGEIEIADEVTDQRCEVCGANLVIKQGRFGRFLACPRFPECRFTKPLLEEIGVPCPKCDGHVVIRRTKKGRKFFGCANYPECDYVSWERPTNVPCPLCDKPLVQKESKKLGTRRVCITEGCGYEEAVSDGEKGASTGWPVGDPRAQGGPGERRELAEPGVP